MPVDSRFDMRERIRLVLRLMTVLAPLRRLLSLFGMLMCLCIQATAAAPTISAFTPISGEPGTQVQIFGSNLRPTLQEPQVFFGNVPANLTLANQLKIVAIVPEKVPIGPITVRTVQGQVTTQTYFFAPPRIENFGTKIIGSIGDEIIFEKPVVGTPNSVLTIIGANFYVPVPNTGVLVKIGSNAIPASATAETQISANIPGVVETGYLAVFTPVTGVNSGVTNTTDYIYGAPRITAFTTNGAAGDSIQIKGFNFLVKRSSDLTVRIGNATATQVDVQSNTNLVAVVPATAATGPIGITLPGGSFITTSNFTVLPKVTTFAPNRGGPGTVVTIVGSGLTGTKQVLFGAVAASTSTITNQSAAQVTAVVPSSVVTGPITLVTSAGTNVTEQLFYGPPQISGFNPASGPPGTSVTLSGVNLLGATSVELNGLGIPQVTVVDNTRILFTVPANATTGQVKVIGPGGTNTSQGSFQVTGRQPVITSFGPTFGPVGTKVTLVGVNLGTVTRVTFNGIQAAFTIKSAASLEATVPAGATTGKIRVTNPDGSSDSSGNFVVGTTADLRLSFGASPNPAVAFGPVTFTLFLVNNGPIPAADTRIEVELPSGLAFLEASSAYPFEVSGQRVTFTRGAMEPQGIFNGQVRANAGTVNASRIVVARVLSPTPDPDPSNNVRQISLRVAPPVVNVESLNPGELLLSWPSAAAGLYSPLTAPTLSSPWVPAPGTPENDGSRIQLTVPATNSLRFFRLQLN